MLTINTIVTECNIAEEDEITRAYSLFLPHIPANSTLTIEETDQRLCAKYFVRLEYKSLNTGRKISLLAKGDTLPTADNDTLRYYLSQILLSPAEVGREFSRIAFRERVARQDGFLFGGGKARGNDIRVSKQNEQADSLGFEDYA